MEYAVRHALVGDAEVLGRLHVQVWQEAYGDLLPRDYLAALDPARRAAQWREVLTHPDEAVTRLVATRGDEPVGFVAVGPARDDEPPAPAELYALNVLAAQHGTGLADRLLEAALGKGPAYLWVLAGNTRAQAFYRRHGFVTDGRRGTHEPTGAAEVRMVRGNESAGQRVGT